MRGVLIPMLARVDPLFTRTVVMSVCEVVASLHSLRHPAAVVLPRQQGWWEWLVNLAFFPLRFVINTTSEFMQFIGEDVCVCVCVGGGVGGY